MFSKKKKCLKSSKIQELVSLCLTCHLQIFLCAALALFLNFSGKGCQIHRFVVASESCRPCVHCGGDSFGRIFWLWSRSRVWLFLLHKFVPHSGHCKRWVNVPRIVGSGNDSSPENAVVCGQDPTRVSNRTKNNESSGHFVAKKESQSFEPTR